MDDPKCQWKFENRNILKNICDKTVSWEILTSNKLSKNNKKHNFAAMDNVMESNYIKTAMRGEGLLLTAQIMLSTIGGITNFFVTFEGRCPDSMITL